jgi:hypothetical protein
LTNEHLRLAKSLAVLASVAIQNARIHERAEIYAAELELRLEELRTAQQALQHASRNPSNDARSDHRQPVELAFRSYGGLGNRRLQPDSATSPNAVRSSVLLLLLLLSVDLAPPGTRLNIGDSFKSKTGVDNRRHTNAHQLLTSHSPIGVSIPPSPPSLKSSVNMPAICALLLVSLCLLYLNISSCETRNRVRRIHPRSLAQSRRAASEGKLV